MRGRIYWIAGIVIIFFILYSYRITETFLYHPDFARDLHDILKIIQGKLTLIGPKLTFGGIYSGPFYYYLFTPVFYLSRLNINSIFYFNILLFAGALGYFFKKSSEKNSLITTLLGTISLGLFPLFLISSRNPGNAFTYIPLLLILLTYIYFSEIKSKKSLFLLGLLGGIIATFHLVTLSVTSLLFLFVLIKTKRKVNFLYLIGGFIAAFLPLIVFEIKHDFIMFKNTFINKSYLSWVNSSNIPGGLSGKKNPIENIFFISNHLKEFTIINPLMYLISTGVIMYFKKSLKKEREWYFLTLGALLFFSAAMRFQFINHYLLPLSMLIGFTTVIILMKTNIKPLFFIMIVLGIVLFPKGLYANSWRKPEPFEKAVKLVIDKKLVDKKSSFNVIQISNPDLLAPIAFEYRYFFRKYGYIPDSEFLYSSSKNLIIFSEIPNFDISKLNSWEVNEFGKENFKRAKKFKTDDRTIYFIEK